MAWLRSVISILFYLLIESFLVGFIILVITSNVLTFGFGLSYLQIVGCVWCVKLLLNNIFSLATYNTSDEDMGIEEEKEEENIIDKNKLA